MNNQIKEEGLTDAYLLGKYDGIKQGRADAIDEFVNECIEYENLTFANEHIERIKKIAEQLKEQNNG